MAGEIYLSSFQIGKEVTAGTPVAATRKMYLRPDSSLSKERESREHRFNVGRRDNVLKRTSGPVVAGGSISMPLSADEIVEWLLLGVKGGVTPTTPGGTTPRLWTFKPDPVLDAATLEWHDGARPWRQTGVRVSNFSIAGEVGGANDFSAELFGLDMSQNALTGALSDRTPTFIEGWETKLYCDALGGTPGTTVVPATLISWDISVENNLTRHYFADNTQAAGDITAGELAIEATVVIRASQAWALTEFNNWEAGTDRLLRFEFGQNSVIETTYKRFVTVDIGGAWTAFDLGGETNGIRTYELSFGMVYDTALAASLQIRAQNNRATAY